MVKVNIGALLKEREMSMYKLAQDTAVAYTTLWKLEKGTTQGISFEVMEAICKELNCTPSDLFTIIPKGRQKK